MMQAIAQRSALVAIVIVCAAAGIFAALAIGGILPHELTGNAAYATSITVSK